MKIKLLFLLFVCNLISAQVVDVITNLNAAGVSNLTSHNNYIYFNSFLQKKVYRFDYTQALPITELVYTFNENPNFMYVNNGILYVGVESPYKTYKIDLSSNNFQPIQIANIAGPMAQIGNDLFIGQYVAGKISKVDLTSNAITDVLSGYKPNFFTLNNNEIYFTSNHTNQLYKFNSSNSTTDVILTNLDYVSGIVFKDNLLFICESMSNSISFYTQPEYQIASLVQLAPNSWPNGNVIVNNDLYFIQTSAGKISKIPLNSTLNNDSHYNVSNQPIVLYPNPATDLLQIKSTNSSNFTNYKIFDNKGVLVQTSNLSDNKINISNLSSGIYTLYLDSYSKTFVKN
ncbi:MAG: T9SS type A sorting domain-containing protein [Flavobacterium sp.]|jgi:hypothetical protein